MNPNTRDAGLRKVSLATRWVLAGGIAVTGALSAVVARSFPGHQSSASASTSTATSPTSSGSGVTSEPGLQAPLQAPSAGSGGGLVRSGAS